MKFLLREDQENLKRALYKRPDSAWSTPHSECNISELDGNGDTDYDLESLAGAVGSKTKSNEKKHVPVMLKEDQDN